jgi:hypothetical protein
MVCANSLRVELLLNTVLDALPAYAMAALDLPPGVLAALDRARRAFLWAAATTRKTAIGGRLTRSASSKWCAAAI